jgi:hypothetical protein
MKITSKMNGSVLNVLFDELLHLSVFVPNIDGISSNFNIGLNAYKINIYMRSGTVMTLQYSKKDTWESMLVHINEHCGPRHPLDAMNDMLKEMDKKMGI